MSKKAGMLPDEITVNLRLELVLVKGTKNFLRSLASMYLDCHLVKSFPPGYYPIELEHDQVERQKQRRVTNRTRTPLKCW